jgi:deoxyribodipyrimidine photo-lyase
MSKTGLFIFRRDLRTFDNTGFIEACSQCRTLYVCFIFTPEQVSATNPYRSEPAIQFMIESLDSLKKDLGNKLMFFYGENIAVIKPLIPLLNLDAIFFNRDYSPYAVKRDAEIEKLCTANSVECKSFADYYLYEPGTIHNGTGGFYKKFTPFYRYVLHMPVEKIRKHGATTRVAEHGELPHKLSWKDVQSRFYKTPSTERMVRGGRELALKRLQSGLRSQNDYDETRDFLKNETTGLSAYIKFGNISIREIYYTFLKKYGLNYGLIRELIWREFFAHVLYNFPEVLRDSYQPKYRNIQWRKSAADFRKWREGQTGFPVVDACMRQLNATGYMHNRGRMIVANFLVKTLLLDWHLGEQYFAQRLTDYDPASNNGNWQGISGTGVDMKPYYRDMNPWIQSIKFDKDAEFIKRWVPELAEVDARDIHRWYIASTSEKYRTIKYNNPMVDYDTQKQAMLKMYKT